MRFTLSVLGLGLLAGTSFSGVGQKAVAAKPECQSMSIQGSNGPRDVLMCKDDKGRWYEAAAPSAAPANSQYNASSTALPAKARVTYQGQYTITITKPVKQKRNPSIFDLVKGGEKSQQQGMVTFDLNIDGSSVSGSMKATGGGQNMGITGMLQNGTCTLYTADGKETYKGHCDTQGFNATITSTGTTKNKVEGTFQASTSSLADVGAEQAKQAQAAANANAEKDAEKQRMEELLKSLPPTKGN